MSLNPNASISNVLFDVCVVAIFISAVHLLSAFRLIQRDYPEVQLISPQTYLWVECMADDTGYFEKRLKQRLFTNCKIIILLPLGFYQWFCHNLFCEKYFFLGIGFIFLGISIIFLRILKVNCFLPGTPLLWHDLHTKPSPTFKSLKNR